EFGRKVVVKLVQETAAMQWQVLLSQLLLLVHMEYEYDEDNEDNALHARFDIGHIYRQIIDALRRLELVRWLVKTQITVPLLKSERSSGSPNTTKRPEETRTITAFEAFISHLLGLEDVDGEPLASSLTDVVIDVCAPNSGIELSPGTDPVFTAQEGPATPSTGAESVLQPRFLLGVSMKNADLRTGGLLDETEKKLLNSGPANYYAHIVSLYDRHKAFSRLFAASTSISRFEMAHATLLSMEDKALKHSCLKRLVEECAETSQTSELIALPFSGLQEEVDDILFQKCKNTVEVVRGTPYHKILSCGRPGDGDNLSGGDVLDTSVTKQFLMLINALSCVDPKQAWITIEEIPQGSAAGKAAKRRVVTLAELRRQYQAELDRIAAIQNNQFGLAAEDDDAMVLDQ
ncbi:hypothetical protein OPQ81_003297, partial [Rhizoctonia solani]